MNELIDHPSAHVAVVYHPDSSLHLTGTECPEAPWRTQAIAEALRSAPCGRQLRWLEPEPASVAQIEAVHSPHYRQFVEELCLSGRTSLGDGDTFVCADSYDVARLAAGAALRAVDAVLTDGHRYAFSCARPPGHHATSNRGMGFCLFNNVAIAAQYALDHYGLNRVAIIDWDVHHGNGTQQIFYARPDVLFCSVQQAAIWPFSGEAHEHGTGPGKGLTINTQAPQGAGFDVYERIFAHVFGPAVARFQPELILISAGFDAHRDDPLAGICLEVGDFAALTRMVAGWADAWCHGRLVSVLEGGYSHRGLIHSAVAHVDALCQLARLEDV